MPSHRVGCGKTQMSPFIWFWRLHSEVSSSLRSDRKSKLTGTPPINQREEETASYCFLEECTYSESTLWSSFTWAGYFEVKQRVFYVYYYYSSASIERNVLQTVRLRFSHSFSSFYSSYVPITCTVHTYTDTYLYTNAVGIIFLRLIAGQYSSSYS